MSQKIENQLMLALETPQEVRERKDVMDTVFDPASGTWVLIVKYTGSLDALHGMDRAEPLIAGYAILTVPEALVEAVGANPQIEYVEKPKNFYFIQEGPSARACIASVTARDPFLSGAGVLVAVIDSGIAYQRSDFRKEE